MYSFVFIYAPMLNELDLLGGGTGLTPLGFIFAVFMVGVMIGANLFFTVVRYRTPVQIVGYILFASAVCFLIPLFFSSLSIVFLALLGFEICVGAWYPCLGTLRGSIVPESQRAALMNFFRVGVNLLVLVVLHQVERYSLAAMLAQCAFWLFLAYFLNYLLAKALKSQQGAQPPSDHLKSEALPA